jgi:hypothetical protein
MMQGYHYTDLFYWEHRLGTWLSGLLRGARADHQTFSLYNCRTVLETLIARPLDERNAANVMFALIRELWPELLSVPIFSGAKYLSVPTVAADIEAVPVNAENQAQIAKPRPGE